MLLPVDICAALVMSETQQKTDGSPQKSFRRVARLSGRWVALVAFLVVVFTGGLWWQSRGLESRILSWIQPHLAADVHIDGLSVSVWRAWPDVEVSLQGVQIEDGLRPGHDFLVMEEVAVRVAWWPLLEDRLEVKSFQLKGGRLDLNRTQDGKQNWVFWKESDGENQGSKLDGWQVDALALVDVITTGSWATSSNTIEWSAELDQAEVSLASEGEQGFVTRGEVRGRNISVASGQTSWMDNMGLNLKFGGRMADRGVVLGIQEAVLTGGQVSGRGQEVEVTGTLVARDGLFGLALNAKDAEVKAVERALPAGVQKAVGSSLAGVSGRADVFLRIGKSALSGTNTPGWSGPTQESWTGGWAAQVAPSPLVWTQGGASLEVVSGGLALWSTKRGWAAQGTQLTGKAAQGEWAANASVTALGQTLNVHVEGQAVCRPQGLSSWLDPDQKLLGSMRIGDGGSVRWSGALDIRGGGQEPWAVDFDPGAQVHLEGVELRNDASVFVVHEATATSAEDGWKVQGARFEAPGVEGSAGVNWNATNGEVTVDMSSLDVDRLRLGLEGIEMEGANGSSTPSVRLWSYTMGGRRMRLGDLEADEWSASGEWKGDEAKIETLTAAIFDGRVSASGTWDGRVARMEGRLVNADFSELLLGTSGLGQNTLRSEHVQGRIWSEGTLTFEPNRPASVQWNADLEVRLEEGQLVEFDLLQAIPSTLAKERKYQFISDAEDLKRRLNRVRFQPISTHITLSRGLITLAPTEVFSDAMDLGVDGWYRLGGEMDFTLDFALRDLKADEGEWGPMEEDGLGHRFFLAMRGTMEEPVFGYDRAAHQEHRRNQRQGAWSRLKGVLGTEGPVSDAPDRPVDRLAAPPEEQSKLPVTPDNLPLDDEDDFR